MGLLHPLLLLFVYIMPIIHLVPSHDLKGNLKVFEKSSQNPTYSLNILTSPDAIKSDSNKRRCYTYQKIHRRRHETKHKISLLETSISPNTLSGMSDVHYARTSRGLKRNPSYRGHRRHYRQELTHLLNPSFDPISPKQVSGQLNSHAFLPCTVHNLGDKTVSWIRNRDAHILTVNMYTFISGNRFLSWYDSETNTWTLQIKFVQKRDMGSYECQVSTEPKMSHFVTLNVIAPEVKIPEGQELHVKSGSDITLKCAVSQALHPPPYVFWYHERSEPSTEIDVRIRQTPVRKISEESSIALLRIKNARGIHAGNYTCAPAGILHRASVFVHVLNGEHPAGLQHGTGPRISPVYFEQLVLHTLILGGFHMCIFATMFRS